MADTDRVFLTPERQAVLEGDYDGAENTERTHRSRIRSRSRTALDELVQVAESPAIDTTEVFDPDDVFRLLRAIMSPDPMYVDGGGLVGGDLDEDRPEVASVDDEFNAYTDRLYVQLDKLMRPYRDERFPPYNDE
jgi:hypothetical protein